MTDKAKRRLTDISFEKAGSHIALVGKAVGSAANGRTTLILKSTNDITDVDIKQKLESIEKAKFYQELRTGLEEKLRDHFKDKLEYNWFYLEDFNDSEVIFSTDGSYYSTGYSLGTDDEFVFDAVAKEIDVKRVYEETKNGDILVSNTAKEAVESGVYELLTKSVDNPETVKRASNLLKSIREKETKKMDEIEKAVKAAKDEAAITIAELQKSVKELTEKVEASVAVEKAAKQAKREAALTEAVGAEKAVALTKSVEALGDAEFETLVETFKSAKQVDQELLVQKSGQGADNTPVSTTEEILKAKFNVK